MEEKVLAFIRQEGLIQNKDHIVIGISGGADSVCLLYLLWQLKDRLGIDLTAVHIHHGLRGVEADEDATFVEELCQGLGVEFKCFHYDIQKVAKEQRISEEEAGRNIRYECLTSVKNLYVNGKIAVAHHMNDQVETILFNLFRGTGLKGLTGMASRREEIIRPLLCCKREEIERYLSEKGMSYREDRTNSQDIYTRNKIRLNILPYVEKEINAKAIENIYRAAILLREEETFLEDYAGECLKSMILSQTEKDMEIKLKPLTMLHQGIKQRVIRKAIQGLKGHHLANIESHHVEKVIELMDKEVGKRIHLPDKITVKKGYDTIGFFAEVNNVERVAEEKTIKEIRVQGEETIVFMGKIIKTKLFPYKKEMSIPKKLYTKWFDYDKIIDTLYIRSRLPGDYLMIKGIGGKKKLKDYLIDEKIPKEERDRIPLLTDGHHIIWIIGYRISEYYKVTENTKNILSVEILDRRT